MFKYPDKWEYMTVIAHPHLGKMWTKYVNDQELPDSERKPIHEYINKLGSRGWELVHVSSATIELPADIYYFKRPVE